VEVRRTSFGDMAWAGSKSFTSAAMLTGKPLASKERITSTPLRPETRESHIDPASFPTGVTAPTPVMATRLIARTDDTDAFRVATGLWRAVAGDSAQAIHWVCGKPFAPPA